MSRERQPRVRSIASDTGETYPTPVDPADPRCLPRYPMPQVISSAIDAGSDQRVTLAHDYLLVMRGAERTFGAMADLYANAPIFTLLYDEQGTNGRFSGRAITASPLQRLPVG